MVTYLSKDYFLFGSVFDPDKKYDFSSSSQSSKKFWDPLGSSSFSEVAKNVAYLEWRAKQLKDHAPRLKLIQNISLFSAIAAVILVLFFGAFFPGGFELIVAIVIILALPFWAVKSLIKSVKVDIIKNEIAKERGWLYDPQPNALVGSRLCKKFSQVLKPGNCNSQSVDDQFWGEYVSDSKSYPFYSGLYSYVVETRSSKSRSRHTYNMYFFCFKLPKKLQSEFLLYPESGFSSWFSSKQINVESIAFNKTFAFSYNGTKGEKALDIVQSLSPSVQESLVSISKLKRGLNVLFEDDVVLFSFPGALLKNPKSKVLGGIDMAQSDLDEIEFYLNSYCKSFIDISSYLK